MRRHAALLTALLLLAAGCSARERANPFDPANPRTGGRPTGFVALADNTVVFLGWDASSAAGLLGFEIHRCAPGEIGYQPLTGLLPVSQSRFTDIGLTNGATYQYRLYYVFAAGLGGLPAEDEATPGTLRPWVADFDGGRLHRLTPDGRHVRASYGGFQSPTEVDVDRSLGVVWTTDHAGGQVVILDPATGLTTLLRDFSRPGAIAVDQVDHSVWVCDEDPGAVFHLAADGSPVPPDPIGTPDLPVAITVDRLDHSIWVCEQDASLVRRFTAAGDQMGSAVVELPSRIAIDSLTREAWVTSFQRGRVVKLSSNLVPLDTLTGFRGPIGVAVDSRRGRVWVADALGNQLVALHRDGSEEFRSGGLPGVRALSLDLSSGTAWATLQVSGEVVMVSPAGVVLRRLPGFAFPYSIAVSP